MPRSHPRRKPSFFWQPLLVLLPVGILAALGFFSLRQDKIIAQHEAVEHAQAIADLLLPRLWSALTNADSPEAFEHDAFQINDIGELLFPPPAVPTPSPEPLNLAELTSEQAGLWQRAELVEASNDIPGAIQAIRDFLNTKPPERFAAVSSYNLASFLTKQGQLRDAVDLCNSVLDKNANQLSEGGLSLDRLAEFKLLELSTMMTNPPATNVMIPADDFCRSVVFDPLPLTPSFLSWVSAHAEALGLKDHNDYWNKIWRQHEESRQLFKSARLKWMTDATTGSANQRVTIPQIFWFNNDGRNCLAIHFNQVPDSSRATAENAFISGKTQWKGPKGKIDLRPSSGKNLLATPNLSYNEPADLQDSITGESHYGGGTPQRNTISPEFSNSASSRRHTESRAVTLDNEPARLDSSPLTKATITSSRGTAERNGMSLPDFSGPAINTQRGATNSWFLCRTESETSQKLFSVLETNGPLPEYFGIAIDIAGKRLGEHASDLRIWRSVGFFEGGGQRGKIYLSTFSTNALASASHSESGNEQLTLKVYLTSPAALFQRQSDRTFWFGSLVAVSAIAAFIGLFSAWRAFNRQQELAELKSNFVSSVSHELRAPIASVRLMAESLERGKVAEPPKQHEYFRFIGQECRRLSSLIENVLDFSRIEQGRKQYEFEPTDLLALVEQTVKLMEPYAIERQISLQLDLKNLKSATNSLELSLDGRAIQQALINLLDNAIKHSPNGETVSVVLESTSSSDASSHTTRDTRHASVHLSVIDHGPGIPPEEHEKIFERFYRLGSELRRETQGVGIGLSIVKHIVEAHGGRVLVQSAPDQGSRFTIDLPMTNEAKPSED